MELRGPLKFIAAFSFLFSLGASMNAMAKSKSLHLDFSSYVRENYEILSRAKKPEKSRVAFEEPKSRLPSSTTTPSNNSKNVDYGLDKNGNISASGGSVWNSMSQQNSGGQQQEAPDNVSPAGPSSGAAGSSSSSGDSLPQ
jgi:hypothetical protein